MKKVLFVSTWFAMFGLQSCDTSPKKNRNKLNLPGPVLKLTQEISKDGKNAELFYQRAIAYHDLKQDSLAIIDLQAAIKIDSSNVRYYSLAGDILFEAKNITESSKYIDKALKLNPNDLVSRLKLAKLFLFTRDYPKSFENINAVLRKDVYNHEAYFLKGVCYKDMGDTTLAIGSFQTAAQIKANDVESLLQLAMLHHKRDSKKAALYYENAYSQDTTNLEPINKMGVMYQELRDFSAAKKTWKRCIATSQNFASAYYNIGCVLMDEDSTEAAMRQFDLAIKMKPSYTEAYYNRGLCKEQLGDKRAAKDDYETALRIDPEYTLAKKAIQEIK
jgi:tetratricopeptide (TPR) repeat protein